MSTPPNAPPPPNGGGNSGGGNPYEPSPRAPQPGQGGQPGFGGQPGQQGQPGQPAYGAPQAPGGVPAFGGAPAPGGASQASTPGYGQPPASPYGASQPGQGQPHGYGQQPGYEQQAYGQPQYGAPAPYEQGGKKSKRGLLIGGGIAASVLLVGGGVFAATTFLGSSGSHPYEVLPGNSIAYAEVDFDPASDQKTAYLGIKDDLNELFDLDEDVDIFESLAEPLGENLDYATDVEPWIGDRVGFSAVLDDSAEEGILGYIAYQIGDADKLADVREKFEVSSLAVGEYLVIASDERDEVLPEAGFTDVLGDDGTFTSDLNALDGNTIANMWMDLSSINDFPAEVFGGAGLQDEFNPAADFEISGRVIAGLHLNSSYVQAQVKYLELDSSNMATDFTLHSDDVADLLANAPADSAMAAAIGGLDDVINLVIQEVPEEDLAEVRELVNSSARELGIQEDLLDPATITALLGSTTGFATNMDGGALYAAGADESLISKLISNLGEAGLDDGSTSVSSEDGTVAVRIGAPSSGKLSDHKHFDDALHNLDSAHLAMFIDIDAVDPNPGEELGVVGVTARTAGDNGEFTLRWVLP